MEKMIFFAVVYCNSISKCGRRSNHVAECVCTLDCTAFGFFLLDVITMALTAGGGGDLPAL